MGFPLLKERSGYSLLVPMPILGIGSYPLLSLTQTSLLICCHFERSGEVKETSYHSEQSKESLGSSNHSIKLKRDPSLVRMTKCIVIPFNCSDNYSNSRCHTEPVEVLI